MMQPSITKTRYARLRAERSGAQAPARTVRMVHPRGGAAPAAYAAGRAPALRHIGTIANSVRGVAPRYGDSSVQLLECLTHPSARARAPARDRYRCPYEAIALCDIMPSWPPAIPSPVSSLCAKTASPDMSVAFE